MANPLASIAASIKLKSNPNLTPTKVWAEVDGTLVEALQVRGIIASPNPGASPLATYTPNVRTVLAGRPYICFDYSYTTVDDLINGFVDTLEFPTQSQVEECVARLTGITCLCPSTSTDEVLVNANQDGSFVVGQDVEHADINASAYVKTVHNQKYTVAGVVINEDSPVVESGKGLICEMPSGQTITLGIHQSVMIGGVLYRVAAAVADATSFTLATRAPIGVYVATIGARLVVQDTGVLGVTAASTTVTKSVNFGSYVRMDNLALGSILPAGHTVTFTTYNSLRTLAEVREGDFFAMAIGITYFDLNTPPVDYRYLSGFVRQPNAATRSFLVWNAEVGGQPITAVEGSNAWFIGASTAESPVINVYQKLNLNFPLHGFRAKCRMIDNPTLAYGPQAMRCLPARLGGRLADRPQFLNVAASDYVRLKPGLLGGRLADAPTLRSVEVSVSAIKNGNLRLRMTKANLSGGFLRLSATVRPSVRKATGIHALQVTRKFNTRISSPIIFDEPGQPTAGINVGEKLEPNAAFPSGASVTVIGGEYVSGTLHALGGVYFALPVGNSPVWLVPGVQMTLEGPSNDYVVSNPLVGNNGGISCVVHADGDWLVGLTLYIGQPITIDGTPYTVSDVRNSNEFQPFGFSGVENDYHTVRYGAVFTTAKTYAAATMPSANVGRKINVSTNAGSNNVLINHTFTRPLLTPFLLYSNGEDIIRVLPGQLTCRTTVANFTGNAQLRRVSPIRGLIRGRATFVISGRGISVRDIVSDILSLWNIRCACPKQSDIRDRVIADINAAMQVIFSRARRLEYLSNTNLTLAVGTDGQAAIPNTVQQVHGTARLRTSDAPGAPSVPLSSLNSSAEVDQFTTLYGGQSRPVAYYIDRTSQAEANSTASVLRLAPKPTGTVYIDLEVAMAAPRYTWQDYDLSTPVHMPVAYAESLLMPIARHRAMTFRLFSNQAAKPQIEQHYRKAMEQLGLNDSAPESAAAPETNASTTKS